MRDSEKVRQKERLTDSERERKRERRERGIALMSTLPKPKSRRLLRANLRCSLQLELELNSRPFCPVPASLPYLEKRRLFITELRIRNCACNRTLI